MSWQCPDYPHNADDWVACLQKEEEARRFPYDMEERLIHFGLELAPEKTKIL